VGDFLQTSAQSAISQNGAWAELCASANTCIPSLSLSLSRVLARIYVNPDVAGNARQVHRNDMPDDFV
jgi:hypothetical protein